MDKFSNVCVYKVKALSFALCRQESAEVKWSICSLSQNMGWLSGGCGARLAHRVTSACTMCGRRYARWPTLSAWSSATHKNSESSAT